MPLEKGALSVSTENIFPIIKKWLYSEKDIFVRELVSNASDAITKLRKLASIGEAEVADGTAYRIDVSVDSEKGTISIADNGIGMTAEEVRSYINQVAFSGAKDFLERYKDKTDDGQIIGHFGLGFYSAFMVADKVTINTLSHAAGESAVFWQSSGGTDFMINDSAKKGRGTEVTLHMSEDSKEYVEPYKLRGILEKYFGFLPIEIYFEDVVAERKRREKAEEERAKAEEERAKADAEADMAAEGEAAGSDAEGGGAGVGAVSAGGAPEGGVADKTGPEGGVGGDDGDDSEGGLGSDSEDDLDGLDDEPDGEPDDLDEMEDLDSLDGGTETGADAGPRPINDVRPLWAKAPRDCTDEDYKAFYSKVFMDFEEPLFWIHLNMDYPFTLKGILYFPKLRHEFETVEGKIKLYYNQVFVADNIKEVIPEFLMLLKGVIDCPDLPLNVSRSFLQNDGSVKKLSDHIAKKVSDRLTSMFEGERERYCGYWDDISPFVKYGCLKDDKFYDRIKEAVVFKSTKGGHVTAKEYAERNDERHKGKVYYVSDAKQQSAYMDMFERNGMEAVILDTLIDGHFISYLEYKGGDVRFARIDSDIADSLKGADDPGGDGARVVAAFEEALKSRSVKVAAQPIKGDPRPGYILLSEHSRRMQEMGARFGGGSMPAFPKDETFSVNTGSEVVMGIASILDDESRKDEAMEICRYVYDVALMSHRPLTPDEMREFASRSDVIVGRMLKGG